MLFYNAFDWPDWENYTDGIKNFLQDKNFKYFDGSIEENNFIAVMDIETIKQYCQDIIDFFQKKNLTVSCIMLHSSCNTEEPPTSIHTDQVPLLDKFYYSHYAINVPIQNVDEAYLAYYETTSLDEDSFTENNIKEISRINYTAPLVVRIDKHHAVCNTTNKSRIAASIRFLESLENFL